MNIWTFFLYPMWWWISFTSCVNTAPDYWPWGCFFLCCMWGRISSTSCVNMALEYWPCGHFSCVVCEEGFLPPAVLLRHLSIDHVDVFCCAVCEEGFLPPAVIIWHLSIDHVDVFFLCCMWGRISSTNCVNTALEYWPYGRFSCVICEEEFLPLSVLKGAFNSHLLMVILYDG